MTRWRHSLQRVVGWAALSIAVTIPVLLWTNRSPPPVSVPTTEDLHAEAARGGYRLIDLGGLRALLERERGRLLLVDTRQDWEYRTGHLPDAISFPFEPTAWSRLKNRGALREALGADRTRPLVFY